MASVEQLQEMESLAEGNEKKVARIQALRKALHKEKSEKE